MQVLHVIPSIAPRYGGPSTAIGPMVVALNRLPGIVAHIATTDADGPGGRLAAHPLSPGLPAFVFRRSFSEQWKFSKDLWTWLKTHAMEYDAIHIHSLWSFSAAAAARAARSAGVPTIVRPAGMLSDYTWGRRPRKKWLYWRLVERSTVFGATGFHVTSAAEASEVQSLRPSAKAFVIPNGVEDDAQHVPVDRDALRRRCGLAAGDRPIVFYMSRLHPKKGIIDLLLPAVAELKSDAFLAIAGGEDAHAPGYAAEVQAAIDRMGLRSRVGMLGPVASADRWQLFDGAAAFTLPSRSENYGIVVAEAMARGCPVVVTEGVQCKDQVIAAGAGIVVPFDPKRLALALDDLLSGQRRDQFGEAGRHYVRQELTWDRAATRIRDMYFTLLN